jgi:membrane protein implicated in regulation of membrane protease activity
LGLTALLVMLLVLFLGVKLWIGLLLLAALDIAELAWAYDELIRKRRKRRKKRKPANLTDID